jgi:hypothetical protein
VKTKKLINNTMGYIRHHAIAVTTPISELIEAAHEKAKEIFGETVSEIIRSHINGYYSFFVAPDGSKEGWHDSEEGDNNRDVFIEWVNGQAYEDGSNSLAYAEFYYGDDNNRSKIVRHN